MENDSLDRRIEIAERCLEALLRSISTLPKQQTPVAEVLEECSASLEELHIVAEEMRRQNEELAAARRVVEGDLQSTEELAGTLEKERRMLQMIMENTHTHLAYLDPQFNFVRVNSAYAQGAGYSVEELIGRNHFELFPHSENEAIFRQVRQTGEPVTFHAKPFVYPNRPELGITYWDWTLMPDKDGNGQVQGLVLSLLDVTERERAQQALRESEEKHRQLIENLHEGIWVIDEDACTTFVNPRMAEMLGYTVDEMQGRHLFSFMDERGVEIARRNLERRKRGIKEQHDFEFLRRDGTRVYALLATSPLTDDGGSYTGAIAGVQDITERKRAEEALRRYADRLQVLHEIDQAILAARSVEEIIEAALSHLRRLVPCLRASVVMFDAQANEMSLLAVHADGETRLGQGEHGSLNWAWFIEGISQGQTCVIEDILALAPSSPWISGLQAEGVRSYVSVPLIAHEKLFGSLNVGMPDPGALSPEQMDIVKEVAIQLAIGIQQARLYDQVRRYADELEQLVTERTAELVASEARFRGIFEGAGIGVTLVDLEGRLGESNLAFQEMLGYSAEQLHGMLFAGLCHPEDVVPDFSDCTELTAGEGECYRAEHCLVRSDGEPTWANLTASVVYGATGEPQFIICMIEDVTEKKQTQTALLQAEKLAIAGKLAASLAHEINNPLQSVIGCLGLAQEALVEGEDTEEYLQVALEDLRRVARVVADLRDLHRPPAPGEREPTDVNTLLERVLTLSRKKCEEHGVEVVWNEAAGLPSLLLEPDRLRQVFLNLLLNALDAMPAGGRLEVSTGETAQPPGVRIAFEDSGEGIPLDVLDRVFEPFYSGKPGGLGLGLFISNNIVKQHGGHIEVESQVGQGTTFTVWLPV